MLDIKPTPTERLILANQFRILAALHTDQAEHYKYLAEVLENGYPSFYGEVFQRLSDELPPSESRYVVDVMSMYSRLQQDNDALESGRRDPSELSFPGFDGNNESNLLGFARFLTKAGRFSALRTSSDLDSHFPTKTRYRKMLAEWKQVGGYEREDHLSAEEIERVLGR